MTIEISNILVFFCTSVLEHSFLLQIDVIKCFTGHLANFKLSIMCIVLSFVLAFWHIHFRVLQKEVLFFGC